MATRFPAPIHHQTRKFPGMTEAQLLEKLAEVNEKLSSGEVIESVGTGDVNTAQRVFRNLKRVQAEIMFDLNVLNPAQYPEQKRINRTSARVC